MPGNQGGRTGAPQLPIPDKGMVFVVGVNQVAMLKLVDVSEIHGG